MPLRNLSASAGSSPLTRGKRLAGCVVPHVVRLIPAHAGKTSGQPSTRHPRAAHPRSRGENQQPLDLGAERRGSSPLTRGKQHARELVKPAAGLIPAHAGKTPSVEPGVLLTTAHPRSRGENQSTEQAFVKMLGSSPLTRGKPINHDGTQ